MNLCIFIGNLVADPETRTVNGKSGPVNVTNFTVAVNTRLGTDNRETAFIDVESWGEQADFVAKWFKKGKLISVQCRCYTDKWTDKESGENRSRLKFRALRVEFPAPNAPPEKGSADERSEPAAVEKPAPATKKSAKAAAKTKVAVPPVEEEDDQDIPF